jgi:hypothetical protein
VTSSRFALASGGLVLNALGGSDVFGRPRALFPALARTIFPGGVVMLGILYAAAAAGALVGSLTSGWLNRVRRPGRAVLIAVAAWGG